LSAKSICLPSIISSHVALRFVLQINGDENCSGGGVIALGTPQAYYRNVDGKYVGPRNLIDQHDGMSGDGSDDVVVASETSLSLTAQDVNIERNRRRSPFEVYKVRGVSDPNDNRDYGKDVGVALETLDHDDKCCQNGLSSTILGAFACSMSLMILLH